MIKSQYQNIDWMIFLWYYLLKKGGDDWLNDRIKIVRKKAKLTQKEFAQRLGIKQNTVASYEIGRIGISDAVINSICREFNVNETWLRTGKGEMHQSLTKSQEIGAFANEVMKLPDEAFKKRFVDALQRLDEKDWKNLEEIANKLLKEDWFSPLLSCSV